MIRFGSITSGEGTRLYRAPSEIRSDIHRINREIRCVSEKFNIRNMLLELLLNTEGESDEEALSELEELCEEARGLLSELGELRDALGELKEELTETRLEMGL